MDFQPIPALFIGMALLFVVIQDCMAWAIIGGEGDESEADVVLGLPF